MTEPSTTVRPPILVGGTRPARGRSHRRRSRHTHVALFGDHSLLQATLLRLAATPFERPCVLAEHRACFQIAQQAATELTATAEVSALAATGRNEARAGTHRPWGWYQRRIAAIASSFKQLRVESDRRSSLQRHLHGAELDRRAGYR